MEAIGLTSFLFGELLVLPFWWALAIIPFAVGLGIYIIYKVIYLLERLKII